VGIAFTSLKQPLAQATIPLNRARVKISDAFKDKLGKSVYITGANTIPDSGNGFCDIFANGQSKAPLARLGPKGAAHNWYFDFPPTVLQDGYIVCREIKLVRIEFTREGESVAKADLPCSEYVTSVDQYFNKVTGMDERLHATGMTIVSGEGECALYPKSDVDNPKEKIGDVSKMRPSFDFGKDVKLAGAYFKCT
jgi:hypothetical protein